MTDEQNAKRDALVVSGERGLITQSAGLAKRGLALADSVHVSTLNASRVSMQEWAQAIRRANSRGELNLLLQLALYLARRNKPPRPQPPLQPPQPVVPPRMPQTTDELVARLRQAVHDGDEEVIQAAIEKSEEIARRG